MVPLKAKNAQSRICTCWWLTSDEDRYRDEGGAGTGSDWITELQMNNTQNTNKQQLGQPVQTLSFRRCL